MTTKTRARPHSLQVRVSPAEHAQLTRAAKTKGFSLSSYLRILGLDPDGPTYVADGRSGDRVARHGVWVSSDELERIRLNAKAAGFPSMSDLSLIHI